MFSDLALSFLNTTFLSEKPSDAIEEEHAEQDSQGGVLERTPPSGNWRRWGRRRRRRRRRRRSDWKSETAEIAFSVFLFSNSEGNSERNYQNSLWRVHLEGLKEESKFARYKGIFVISQLNFIILKVFLRLNKYKPKSWNI